MIVTRNPDIWNVKVIDEDGKIHGTSGTRINSNVSFHYIQNVDGFDKNLEFKMYSYEDELLYQK